MSAEFEQAEWDGIALRAQQEVAAAQIAMGEEMILSAARAKVTPAMPGATQAQIDRRAKALLRATRTMIADKEKQRDIRRGIERNCHNCRYRGMLSGCAHPLGLNREQSRMGGITVSTGRNSEMRSEDGACGPEAVLWRRRWPLQIVRHADRGTEWMILLMMGVPLGGFVLVMIMMLLGLVVTATKGA